MSCTPKPVRRNRGDCTCADSTQRLVDDQYTEAVCRYRCCMVLRCTACLGALCSWGPVGCKCDSGARWLRHPGMRVRVRWEEKAGEYARYSVAVKPSLVKFKRYRAGFR